MFLVRDFSVFSISSFFLVLIIDRRLYLFPAPAAGVEKFCFLNALRILCSSLLDRAPPLSKVIVASLLVTTFFARYNPSDVHLPDD